MTSYLDLADFLLIAERVLGVDAKTLGKGAGIGLADSALNAPAASFGGVDFYPDFPRKAAVLLEHLVKNHPLPDGNKRTAYACLREFLARNGYLWVSTTSDDVVVTMVRVATSEIGLDELTDWVFGHTGDTAG
ncbi:MAG: type II toxin-antitoxin system death-on-curing family toxin [Acidimicrobiales bacterium]